jgi:membrane protease YdiL (CAAX protease family)
MTVGRTLLIVTTIETIFGLAAFYFGRWHPLTPIQDELVSTAVRIVTALIYWRFFKSQLLSRKTNSSTFRSGSFITGLLLFLSIPVLVGYWGLTTPVAMLFAITSVPVAIKEEFLFRGIIQNLLAEKFGFVKSIVITSTLFLPWHLGSGEPSIWYFSQVFLASAIIGVIYIHSGSLIAAIIVHATYDTLFAFSPLIPMPLNQNSGFIPLIGSVAFILYWASRSGGPTNHSTGPAQKAAQAGEFKR